MPSPQERHIIQLMPFSMVSHRVSVLQAVSIDSPDDKISFPSRPAVMFINEAHLRTGAETAFGKAQAKFVKESAAPVPIFFCSATAISSGAKNLSHFFDLTIRSASERYREATKEWITESAWTVTHSEKAFSDDPAVRKTYEAKVQHANHAKQTILRPIMHREVENTRSPVEIQRIECPLALAAKQFIMNLARETDAQLNDLLQSRIKAWNASGRRGDKPTISSILEASRPETGRYRDMQYASVFPMAAKLFINAEGSDEVKKLFQTERRTHQKIPRASLLTEEHRRSSKYSSWIKQIAPPGGSSKLAAVVREIRQMRKGKVEWVDPESENGTPKYRNQKMLLGVTHPLCMHWLWLALLEYRSPLRFGTRVTPL